MAKKCNSCGEVIESIGKSSAHNDCVEIEKEWGYFSQKDLQTHRICICEKCYDKWVKSFVVPVKVTETKEIFKF